jgi:putative transposase
MTDLLWLSDEQLDRIKPYFPRSHGVPRVDDHRVVSGIVFVIRNGLRWRDAPKEYGPHKTLYNRFIRWSRIGVFDRIFANLAGQRGKPDRLIVDATHLKAHRRSERLSLTVNVRLPASLFKKGLFPAVSDARKAA